MKQFLLFTFCLSVMSIFVSAQDFREVMRPPIQSISGGCMLNSNTMFLSGTKHNIYKSLDGGNTWDQKFTMDTTLYNAYDISFGTATVGYCAGYRGKVAKTVDAGETWNLVTSPDTTYTIYGVKFFDAAMGYVLGVKGSGTSAVNNLYKTTDGGTTWTIVTTVTGNPFEGMDFYSPTKGIMVGGGTGLAGMLIYYTTDGTTWTKAPIPTIPSYGYTKLNLHAVKYVNETLAYGVGWGSYVAMQPSIFVKTTDGGATWTYLDQAAQNKVYVNINCLYFKDAMNGISAGQYTYPGTVIMKTSDGGVNWVQTYVPSGFSPQVILGDGDKLLMAGAGGNILYSTDFGVSWTMKNQLPNSTLYSIKSVGTNIFSAGYESNFYKSTDNGNSFSCTYLTQGNVSLRPNDIEFVNENLGYAACMYGQILKTTNAGTTWAEVFPDTNVIGRNNNGVSFRNENLGFVAGVLASNTDVIYKTTNGGSSWEQKEFSLAGKTLNCIAFGDDDHGSAGANTGRILFTSDKGDTWALAVVNATGEPAIKDIDFFDGQTGIAVGASAILKTTNGGAAWNSITPSFLDKELQSVVYKDANTIYAGGDKYLIKSTDSGTTWTLTGDSVYFKINRINALDLDDAGYVWIATSSGMVVTNSPLNAISDQVLDPGSFSLDQNYPNPFNPSTTISFALVKRGYVTLKLFDILGREVKEIFKGELEGGSHKILFDASGLASGSYIYSLQVNDQFTSRKMTLLK